MARSPKEPQPEPRRGRAAEIGLDAGNAAAAAFARAGFTDPSLVLRWSDVAGPEVARLAQPLKLSGDILTLRALPGAALFLAHEKRELAGRINAFLGRQAVNQIKFVQGVFSLPPPSPKPAPRPGRIGPADPVRVFAGPERLGEALKALARRRNPD